jgi:hypothetical protein
MTTEGRDNGLIMAFEMISKVNEKIIAEERKKKLKMIRKLKKKKILR